MRTFCNTKIRKFAVCGNENNSHLAQKWFACGRDAVGVSNWVWFESAIFSGSNRAVRALPKIAIFAELGIPKLSLILGCQKIPREAVNNSSPPSPTPCGWKGMGTDP